MGMLFNIGFYGILGLWSAVAVPVGIGVYVLYRATGHEKIRKWARTLNWLYGRVSIWLMNPFFRIRLINMDEAKKAAPCIVVCNHQSILDLYMLGAQDCDQVCPITKSWPFRLLFPFAPAMSAAGYIDAERMSLGELENACRQRLRAGCVLVFYPEGRRALELGKFHAGAFQLALAENLPIVPMRISGSGKAIAPGSLRARPGEISVEMLPAIRPEQYAPFRSATLPHRALMKYVRDKFKKEGTNAVQADASVAAGRAFSLRRLRHQEFYREKADGQPGHPGFGAELQDFKRQAQADHNIGLLEIRLEG